MALHLSVEALKELIQDSKLDRRGLNIIGRCPNCGELEFGVSIAEGHRFGCYRLKSCGFTGNIYSLLKKLGKLSTFLSEESLYQRKSERLENKILVKKEGLDLSLDTIKMPFGYKRIFEHEYLDLKRKQQWQKSDYERYEVGITNLDTKLFSKYIIFPVREANEIKGYVARSRYTKEETKRLKEETGWETLRYQNSESDFGKLLYGIDNLTENTHTVILQEGILDNVNTDRQLELYKNEEIKCLSTFKCDLSLEQLYKIQQFPNIKNIILFYDPDVMKKIKQVASEIEYKFDNVLVAISSSDNDPGDMGFEEIVDCIANAKTVTQFLATSGLQKKSLKQ